MATPPPRNTAARSQSRDFYDTAMDISLDARADSVAALAVLSVIRILGGLLSWPSTAWPWMWTVFVPLLPLAMEMWVVLNEATVHYGVALVLSSLGAACSVIATVFMAISYSETRDLWQLMVTVASFLITLECITVLWVEGDILAVVRRVMETRNISAVVRTRTLYTRQMDGRITPWAARCGAIIVFSTVAALWMVAWPPWAWGSLGLPVAMAWSAVVRAIPLAYVHVSVYIVCCVALSGAVAGAFVDAAECGAGRDSACFNQTFRPWICYVQAILLAVGLICVMHMCSHAVKLRNMHLALAVREHREKIKSQ